MAISPIVLCLSQSGYKTARKIANILGSQIHGREGRVEGVDATFENALDHIRVLFGSTVIPLLGGHRGANRLARQIANGLKSHASITTAGDIAMGVALDEPPIGYRLQNFKDAKPVMASLLNGSTVRVSGENIFDINSSPSAEITLVVSEAPMIGDEMTFQHRCRINF